MRLGYSHDQAFWFVGVYGIVMVQSRGNVDTRSGREYDTWFSDSHWWCKYAQLCLSEASSLLAPFVVVH